MATKRTLGFDPYNHVVSFREAESWSKAENPTDAEVADLLARVLEAAGHKVPESIDLYDSESPETLRLALVRYLAYYRAALARDAEKAEQEQEIEALAKRLYETADQDGHSLRWPPNSSMGAREWWLLRAQRAYELGARA